MDDPIMSLKSQRDSIKRENDIIDYYREKLRLSSMSKDALVDNLLRNPLVLDKERVERVGDQLGMVIRGAVEGAERRKLSLYLCDRDLKRELAEACRRAQRDERSIYIIQ